MNVFVTYISIYFIQSRKVYDQYHTSLMGTFLNIYYFNWKEFFSRSSDLYLNMSFSDILAAKKDDPPSSKENSFNLDMGEKQVLSKMDEFLDNALDELSSTVEYEDDDDYAPSPPKISKSASFEYKANNEESNPLVHTVSFYRKQQQNSLNVRVFRYFPGKLFEGFSNHFL